MSLASPQPEPILGRPSRKRRQDTAILVTFFAFAIAITPEFTFLGIPKVRVTDFLLLPLLAYIGSRQEKKRRLPLLTIFSWVIVWDVFVLLLSGRPDTFRTGLFFIGKRVAFYLIFLVGYSAVQSRAIWERTISGLLLATPILALSVLLSVRTDSHIGDAQRASGIIANQQTSTALFFVILITLCLGALPVWKSPWARLVAVASLCTGLPAMFATGTRGALVDILVGVGALEVLRKDLTRSLTVLIAAALIFAAAWSFMPSGLQQRLGETVPHIVQTWENRENASVLAGGNSAADRYLMARDCFRYAIWRAPITGHGMAYRSLGFVDNFLLTEWAYNGLVGLVLMVMFLMRLAGLVWLAYKRARDPLERGIAAGVFASILAMWMATFHSDSFFLIRPMEALMLLAGLVVGCSQLEGKDIPVATRKKRRPTLQDILDSRDERT